MFLIVIVKINMHELLRLANSKTQISFESTQETFPFYQV